MQLLGLGFASYQKSDRDSNSIKKNINNPYKLINFFKKEKEKRKHLLVIGTTSHCPAKSLYIEPNQLYNFRLKKHS